MTQELLDILDEKGNLTGITKPRSEVHAKGLWHQSVHVWIYTSKGKILIQKRSKNKDSNPGLWHVSAAGHIPAGETPEMGAVRETREELGLEIDPKNLEKIEIRKVSEDYTKTFHNNEFNHIYILKFDGKPSQLKIQKEELEAIDFVQIKKLESEIKDEKKCKKYVPQREYVLEMIKIIKEKLKNK